MTQVRTFRWGGGENGFDVVDTNVYRVRDGKRGDRSYSWTLEQLEAYAKSEHDSLEETTPKVRAEVHTTRVLLVNGEVTSVEDAKALRDELQQAIAEFEGEQKKSHAPVDYEARNSNEDPDFPGQVVVTNTWTATNEGDGWVRVAVSGAKGSEPEDRVHLKIRDHLLTLINEMHGDRW